MKKRFALLAGATACLVITIAAMVVKTPQDNISELPINEFMGHVMQRNAEQLWRWTELEIDAKGERYVNKPEAEDWENAESDALTLQQLTYALEHSRYAVREPRWTTRITALRAAATASADAAERKDFAALVRAGDRVNEQCVACHFAFAPQLEEAPPPPNF